MPVSINGTNGLVFADGSTQGTASPGRNRIINGAMMIDQRNAGASVTVNNNQQYPVDRFIVQSSTSTQFTAQQSSVAPTGFSNSLLITTSSANSSGFNAIIHRVEANNTADFNIGTASASSFTLSFWVRSSVTGTHTFYVQNNGSNYSYVTTYTISAANTWEKKTITIAGPTAGTWLTGNSCSLQLAWSLGGTGGTTSTLNAWQSANVYNATGATGIFNTASATFYITGVQLEKGAAASDFDFRSYGQELLLCQRYYEVDSLNSGGAGLSVGFSGYVVNGNTYYSTGQFTVTKRAAPTVTLANANNPTFNAVSVSLTGINSFFLSGVANSTSSAGYYFYTWTASAEL